MAPHVALGWGCRIVGRLGVAEDVVGPCIFLASKASDYITGTGVWGVHADGHVAGLRGTQQQQLLPHAACSSSHASAPPPAPPEDSAGQGPRCPPCSSSMASAEIVVDGGGVQVPMLAGELN